MISLILSRLMCRQGALCSSSFLSLFQLNLNTNTTPFRHATANMPGNAGWLLPVLLGTQRCKWKEHENAMRMQFVAKFITATEGKADAKAAFLATLIGESLSWKHDRLGWCRSWPTLLSSLSADLSSVLNRFVLESWGALWSWFLSHGQIRHRLAVACGPFSSPRLQIRPHRRSTC